MKTQALCAPLRQCKCGRAPIRGPARKDCKLCNLEAVRRTYAKHGGAVKYQTANVQRRGFKNLTEYMDMLAQRQGFTSYSTRYAGNMIKKSRAKKILKQQATLPWAGDVTSIYREAQLLTEWEGVRYVVDHIVPLKHPLVSGLHVEANLQLLTAEENAKKSNRWWPDMPSI